MPLSSKMREVLINLKHLLMKIKLDFGIIKFHIEYHLFDSRKLSIECLLHPTPHLNTPAPPHHHQNNQKNFVLRAKKNWKRSPKQLNSCLILILKHFHTFACFCVVLPSFTCFCAVLCAFVQFCMLLWPALPTWGWLSSLLDGFICYSLSCAFTPSCKLKDGFIQFRVALLSFGWLCTLAGGFRNMGVHCNIGEALHIWGGFAHLGVALCTWGDITLSTLN